MCIHCKEELTVAAVPDHKYDCCGEPLMAKDNLDDLTVVNTNPGMPPTASHCIHSPSSSLFHIGKD